MTVNIILFSEMARIELFQPYCRFLKQKSIRELNYMIGEVHET